MPELTNSTRRLYKATYVQVKVDDSNPEDVQAMTATNRAADKVAFVRELDVKSVEIERVEGPHDVNIQRVRQVAAVASRSPSVLHVGCELAEQIAAVSVGEWVTFARAVSALRSGIASATVADLNAIARAYEAAHQVADSNRSSGSTAPAGGIGSRFVPPPRTTAPPPPVSPVVSIGENQIRYRPRLRAVAPTNENRPMASARQVPMTDHAVLVWGAVHEKEAFARVTKAAAQYVKSSSMSRPLSTLDDIMKAISILIHLAGTTPSLIDGFVARTKVEPIGRLHLERMEMLPVGIERGELVHSVPLTPGEVVNISHREWSLRGEEFTKIVQDFFEGYSEEGVAEKNELAQSTESQSRHSSSLDAQVALSASYGPVSLSSSVGYNTSSDDSESKKDSRNHATSLTRLASARVRRDHRFSFKVTSLAETEETAARTIKNPSVTDAMRVDYFQLMRKWRVDLYRYGLRMTYDIVIPNPAGQLLIRARRIQELEDALSRTFDFGLQPTDITEDNWANLAALHGTTVDGPVPETVTVRVDKLIDGTNHGNSNDHWFEAIEAVVEPEYVIEHADFYAVFSAFDGWFFDAFFDGSSASVSGGNTEYSAEAGELVGRTGKVSIPFAYKKLGSGSVSLTLVKRRTTAAFEQWRLRTWAAIRQSAEEKFAQARQDMRDERQRLADSQSSMDALSLRRMEREELVRGVLRWLFGPGFDLMPPDIQSWFQTDPQNVGGGTVLLPGGLATQEWQRALQWGELIKFFHNAIEWENVLYFLYPYFWDHPNNWDTKRFLEHPDARHRDFLRAGAARVVLTVRPGFEKALAMLLEGQPGLASNHPYVRIAEEIENYARTNYPGIPPANPNNRNDDGVVEAAEKGILIGRWFEYTSTPALDIAINSTLPEIA